MSNAICTKKLAQQHGIEPFCRCPRCNNEEPPRFGHAGEDSEFKTEDSTTPKTADRAKEETLWK